MDPFHAIFSHFINIQGSCLGRNQGAGGSCLGRSQGAGGSCLGRNQGRGTDVDKMTENVMKWVHMQAIKLIFGLATSVFNFPSPYNTLSLKLCLKIINLKPKHSKINIFQKILYIETLRG